MSAWEEGNPNSKILFLAQAPHTVEVRLDRPLVGPSGEVFNTCLHQAGLVRASAYILNLWPYKVETNAKTGEISKDGRVLWTQKGITEYGWSEAATTLAKIKASGCNIVVTLGQQAFEAMAGVRKPMLKWRGSPLQGTERTGKKFIPTIHPAATLHGTYLWRYLIISDFTKAKRMSDYPDLRLPKRNHVIRPTMDEIVHFMTDWRELAVHRDRHYELPMVATDLEVINHQIACFCLCYDPHLTITIPFTTQSGDHYWPIEEEIAIWQMYARLMSEPGLMKVNQNIVGFDAPFLVQQNNIFTRGCLGDNMVAQSIMYPEFRKGLDVISSIYTDEPYYKDEGKMWKGFGGDIEEFWVYNGKDGAVSMEAWIEQSKEMTEGDFWPTYQMTVDLYEPLAYMTVRGFATNRDKLNETKGRVAAALLAKEAELADISEVNFNPLSPKQCQQYFYVLKGLQPYVGAGGTVTTDDKAMARIYRRYGLKEAKLVQEIRALNKLKGTYLEVDFDKDSRLRCAWNPRGTWTGRLSSSETLFGTGMNMQNLHPEFKEFLVADPELE